MKVSSPIDGSHIQQHLRCEHLEDRDTPAGNVSAALVGGDLYVLGDSNPAGNQVGVVQDNAGNVFVVGLNGTTVNGQSQVFVGTGNPNRVSIQLGGTGPNRAEVDNVWTNFVDVTTGSGADEIVFNGVQALNISADAGAGDDAVLVQNVAAWRGANLSGGEGNDTLYLFGITGPTNFQQFERFNRLK